MTDFLKRRLVADGDPGAAKVQVLAVRVGEALQARSAELNRSMNAAIEDAIEVLDDPELVGMLHASVEGNISTIVHMLVNEIPIEHVQVATAATEYAVRLAQAGISSAPLRRAYHIGSDDLLAEIFEEIERLDCAPEVKLRLLHHMAGWLHRYVDWITREVIDVHEAERQAQLMRNADQVSHLVQRVLDGEPVDPEQFRRTCGYRLHGRHVAAVVWVEGAHQAVDWIDGLREFADKVAAALGGDGPPFFKPIDRSTAWVWVRLPYPRPDLDRIRALVPPDSAVRVALGEGRSGVEGFARTLAEARRVRVVPQLGATQLSRVVGHGEDAMAVVAVLARDLATTRDWVRSVLGKLAVDTEAAARLRETVRVFQLSGSYVQAAEELMLHRNSVKYRLEKAAAERGRPLSEDRLDLALALQACRVLGTPVLDAEPDQA
ncbi:helix-turn-helix domain-containing protein [Nocardioides sp. AE5]|uniref:PucR family transcriptional regulator n=1 Tax=Nocardioides sp. AE5 TaxID=2962573 RepID=UPI0028827BA3|nr:helix-turn-helix domain-containing protein [Nocardioides sp. AE5]MDT0203864.1 helix-turn-helix domain-containing protein [Nocardioides sp. AE5]